MKFSTPYPIRLTPYALPHTPIKVVLTGGGTAGHILPLIAVSQELKSINKDTEFLFIGPDNDEERLITRKYNLNYLAINSGKIRRYFDWQNFIDPFKSIAGFIQSVKILKNVKPDVIFAKGGYATFPVVLAGWFLKIPIIIHESDSVMGLANKIESKLAKKVCVGFPTEFYPYIKSTKLVYTGNPIRKNSVLSLKPYPSKPLHLTPLHHKPTILVTGGSQGAHFINQTILAILPKLLKKYHIIHICGKNDYSQCQKYKFSNYELYDFTDKILDLMKKADLTITRAGASTLAEISSLSKPALIIPLPASANNHQLQNAKVYEKNKAAVVILEQDIIPDNLRIIIEGLLNNKNRLKEMRENTHKLFKKDAAELISKEIINLTSNV
ncbi:MAG: undecaprenyldiphospho-muramoylpentapeptide beta-N-acetylglucosaminyltransferase [Patescibacteria group bacterium]|nr:undecaprenyldiphospho-muramoylpentapeptide beta-N-acetylglucosaminyltransferase [Patescibacteria group bacterium]